MVGREAAVECVVAVQAAERAALGLAVKPGIECLRAGERTVDANGVVKENIPVAEAEEIKAKLEEVGATVEVK